MTAIFHSAALACLALGWLAAPLLAAAEPSADADWKALLTLSTAPREPATSREQARTVALAHLGNQEAAIQRFLRDHPEDPRCVDAKLRLAQLLSIKADFSENPALNDAAIKLLDGMLNTVPEPRRADVAFAKISLTMRGILVPTDADREAITARMQAFRKQFSHDRRIAGLLVEVATLYDAMPRKKEAMLNEAFAVAQTDEMRARISDDLKRLSFLSKEISLQGMTADGNIIDVAQFRGKVVLIYFFASWSAPSIAALEEVHYLRRTFPETEVAVVGINLDSTREALTAAKVTSWPVLWDGKGWESPLVRDFGINAIPTLWIVDRKGALRTLNAKTESESLIRSLLKDR